jgi:hypothetical protein
MDMGDSIDHNFDDDDNGFLDGDVDNAIDLDDENNDYDGFLEDDDYSNNDYNHNNAPAGEYANDAFLDEAQGARNADISDGDRSQDDHDTTEGNNIDEPQAGRQSTQGIYFTHATRQGPGISDLQSTNPSTTISPTILRDNLSSMGRSTGGRSYSNNT